VAGKAVAPLGRDHRKAGAGRKRSSTKSWPSRLSPLIAKNASPGATVRVSIEMPGMDSGNGPADAAPIAAAIASTVQSGRSVMPPSRQARRRPPRGR
jgi:hypothetical protein